MSSLNPLPHSSDTDAPMTGDLVGNGYPNAQMQDVLDTLQELGPQPIENLTPDEARVQPTPADAVMALLAERHDDTTPQPTHDVDDFRVLTPEGEIPVRVYTPDGHGPFPVLVYAHGGGWVIADVQTYDASCRALANAVPCVVVSVEYRRAPEHPFPAAVEDVYAVYRWALNNAMEINGDPGRVAIAGESAGGNMATVVCQMAQADGVPLPLHQVLVYPVTDFTFDSHSYAEHGDAKPLNRDMMVWFTNHYLPDAADRTDWRAAPLRGNLRGLPPATIILAEIDPLRADGEAYLEALRAAGVEARGTLYHGVTHEFFGMTAVLDAARDAVAEVAADLRMAFDAAHPEADTMRAANADMGTAAGIAGDPFAHDQPAASTTMMDNAPDTFTYADASVDRFDAPPSEAAATADEVTRETLQQASDARQESAAETNWATHVPVAPDRGKATNTYTDVDMGTRRRASPAAAADGSVDISQDAHFGTSTDPHAEARFEADMHHGTVSLSDPGTEHSLKPTAPAGEMGMDMDMAAHDSSGRPVDMAEERGMGADLQHGMVGSQSTHGAAAPTGGTSAGVSDPTLEQGRGVGVGRDARQDPGMQPNVNADMDMGITSDAAAGGGSTRVAEQQLAEEVDRSIGMEVETPHAMGAVSGNDTATDYLRESMADRQMQPNEDPQRRQRDDAYTGDRRDRSRESDATDETYPTPDREADPLLREPAASDPAIDPTRGDDDLPEQPGVEPDPDRQNAAALVHIGDLVLGADANPIGRVIDIRPDGLVVDRVAQPNVLVPLEAVSRAEAGQAVLYLPANDVSAMQWDQGGGR